MAVRQAHDPERIVLDPDVLAGKPTIRGTRVPVALVVEYLARNLDFDEFFADYPEVTLADVQAALAYARTALDRPLSAAGRRRPSPRRTAARQYEVPLRPEP